MTQTPTTQSALDEAGPCCAQCGAPFPRRRRNAKTNLCRHCWSIKSLAIARVVSPPKRDRWGLYVK